MTMTAEGYRGSLRAYKPRVFVNGQAVESVADEPLLAPSIAAVGVTYDLAHREEHAALMTARQGTSGKVVNRMLHIDETAADLLAKLEAVRLVCRISGCAQRYLAHDALNALFQATKRTDEAHATDYHQRVLAYLHEAQDRDLALGIAMTDAEGDRSKRPGQQANPDVYVHIVERRPGEPAAKFSAKYGQSTSVVIFNDVFVPHERVFLAGETGGGGSSRRPMPPTTAIPASVPAPASAIS